MRKVAVGKQIGGFTQTRSGTRPYRIETLINKDLSRRPSELFEPDPEKRYEQSLVEEESPEFTPDTQKTAAELKSKLLPHQQKVVDRFRDQPGLVVAHGTGSGKTLSSIGAIADLNPDKARVLVPAALQKNYEKEVDKHVRGKLPVQIESLQKAVKDGNPPRGDLLIVDEAHRVRNPQSKSYKMLQGTDAQKRMLLTASPVYNSPEDIAPLVNLAADRKELPEGADFRKTYVRKADRGLFALVNPWANKEPQIVRKGELGRVLNRWVDYHSGSDEGFPSLSEERINVPMSKRQSQLHEMAWGKLPLTTRMRLKRELPPEKKDLPHINRFQSQTRQISSSEKKYVAEGDHETSPKIQAAVQKLRDRAEKDPQHKAVVYANYLGTLDDYGRELQRAGVPFSTFRGDMGKRERNTNISDFNDGRVRALLVSGAGGEGLDLKGARQVQVLEPHWNEEKLLQVIGRARRYGSHDHLPPAERNVHVERYAARPKGLLGSKRGIEDVLYDTAAQKQRLNQQVLRLLSKTGSVFCTSRARG